MEELLKKIKPFCAKIIGAYIKPDITNFSKTKYVLYNRQRSFGNYQQKHHIFSARNHPGRGKAIIKLSPEQHKELHQYFDCKKQGKIYTLLPHEQLLLLIEKQKNTLDKHVYDLMYTTLTSLSPNEIYKPLFVKGKKQKKSKNF